MRRKLSLAKPVRDELLRHKSLLSRNQHRERGLTTGKVYGLCKRLTHGIRNAHLNLWNEKTRQKIHKNLLTINMFLCLNKYKTFCSLKE